MHVNCSKCGEEHDLAEMEPSYRLPDAIHAIAEAEREDRVRVSDDFAALWGVDGVADRWFVRTLVPIVVHGEAERCHWGVWAEISEASFDEVRARWEDADQATHGPWHATLANELATYPSTLRIRGTIAFVDPRQVPHFRPNADQTHPFVRDFECGVSAEVAAAWKLALLHPM